MRNASLFPLTLLAAAVCASAAQSQMTRPSFVNLNISDVANPNPPPLPNERVITVTGDYDAGRDAGANTDNLPVSVKVVVERVETIIIGRKTFYSYTIVDDFTYFPPGNPPTASGSYTSKNFYLPKKTSDNPPKNITYHITSAFVYTNSGGGQSTRTAVQDYTPATAP